MWGVLWDELTPMESLDVGLADKINSETMPLQRHVPAQPLAIIIRRKLRSALILQSEAFSLGGTPLPLMFTPP